MGSLFSSAITLRNSVRISDDEFTQLRDFIYDKCGIFVDAKRKYLFESRFSKRLAELGLSSFSDYIKFLKHDIRRNSEMNVLFELVTTNETSFYRDTRQLDAFRDNVLREALEKRRSEGRLDLHIWSAGCSSGEEPYTLSILLHEMLGPEIARWRIRITAVDLSPQVIERARRGVYREYAFKTTPDQARDRYFTPHEEGWKIRPELGRLISFQTMNLNDPLALKRVPRSHIVFCRNVIIYFDEAMKKRVAKAFYDNLLPGGYLMLGHSETLHKISSAFQPVYLPGSIAYRKEE